MNKGHRHPLSQATREIVEIFNSLGFSVAEGPEIETEYNNFDALNIPPDHPARDLWDTFWIKPRHLGKLLRTHTSPVQIRYMSEHKPPLAVVVPGKTFRYEATDATHEAQFHQVEGLLVGEGITLAHLKGVLTEFFSRFFNAHMKVRLRPSYFPFVEPGVEIDMSCVKCAGSGCSLCKHTGWIEIMGAGMVHQFVLDTVGVDPEKYTGFAFGGGIDRMVMLKHGIDDIRLLYSGDLRLVNQF